MSQTAKLFRYQIRNVARGKAVLGYGIGLLLISVGLVRFAGGAPRALLSLGNVALTVVPLVSLILGTIHFYDSREFDELVLAHPVGRRSLFAGLYLGLTLPLLAAFVLGVGLPLLLGGAGAESLGAVLTLLMSGAMLTAIFVSLAYWIAVRWHEPVKALGMALVVWLFFAVLYDGVVLLVANTWSEYPLERPMLGLMMLNPIDLARVLLLMELDVAALMGYTGAVFSQFFGSGVGAWLAAGVMGLWIGLPVVAAARRFDRTDL